MRVTKAQAQANREHIVETASTVFRERGYDGVGVADLMAAAGFTHGGFYKHFKSKSDLMEQSAVCGISKTIEQTQDVDLKKFINYYLSREHRDARGSGCTIAALGGDAARQPEQIKATYAVGIENLLKALSLAKEDTSTTPENSRPELINSLAHALGAIVLSRACPNDSLLADEILSACRKKLLGGDM